MNSLDRITFFIAIVSIGFVCFPAAADSSARANDAELESDDDGRPNILFIYTDDQSYRTVGCYPESYDWVKTPNIDRLAKQGIRFSYGYIGTWCMPSRASMLTGRHQHAIESMRLEGPYPASTYDPKQCPFWPSLFRKSGYETAQIGKWHTGTDTGFGRDWDFQIVWNRPKFSSSSGNYYYKQPVTFHGGETRVIKEYSTDKYTDWAVDFIQERKSRKKPWYLWLCYGAVHGPYTPADRHKGNYAEGEVPTPRDIFPPRKGKPDWVKEMNLWKPDENGIPRRGSRALDSYVRQYNEGVRAIDEGVGRLIEALEQTGQRRRTLVVFTSDQGFAWGQHGFQHKLAGYDSNIRVPLIFSFPGRLPEAAVCPTPVGGVDLVPTFFHYAGIDPPKGLHGHDLSPLLENPAAQWSHPVLIAHTGRLYGSATASIPTNKSLLYHGGVPWYVMLRQGKYKYIRTMIAGEPEELYDLQADPEELENLAFLPEYQETLRTFRRGAVEQLRRTEARFADSMPTPSTER